MEAITNYHTVNRVETFSTAKTEIEARDFEFLRRRMTVYDRMRLNDFKQKEGEHAPRGLGKVVVIFARLRVVGGIVAASLRVFRSVCLANRHRRLRQGMRRAVFRIADIQEKIVDEVWLHRLFNRLNKSKEKGA